ncbi:hypothetical protein [Daejeonella sp.]|uniref:tetratricopeptide repeat protein n=1 Tax=Daejeonella sp. TaxID=2805397 RepID=UPI0030C2D89D
MYSTRFHKFKIGVLIFFLYACSNNFVSAQQFDITGINREQSELLDSLSKEGEHDAVLKILKTRQNRLTPHELMLAGAAWEVLSLGSSEDPIIEAMTGPQRMETARNYYRQAVAAGNMEAQVRMIGTYRADSTTHAYGMQLAEKAVAEKIPGAGNVLAFYLMDSPSKYNLERALQYFMLEKNYAMLMQIKAGYVISDSTYINIAEAIEYGEKFRASLPPLTKKPGRVAGNVIASDMLYISHLYGRKGPQQNLKKAFEFKMEAYKYCPPFYAADLADCYFQGIGTSKNVKKGIAILEEQQDYEELAELYYKGDKLSKDYKKVMEYLLIPFQIGDGPGVRTDTPVQSFFTTLTGEEKWDDIIALLKPYSKSLDGFLWYTLATAYTYKVSQAEATAAYLESANLNYFISQIKMANNYLHGYEGVTKDEAEALKWFTKAATNISVSKEELADIQFSLALKFGAVEEKYSWSNDKDMFALFSEAYKNGHRSGPLWMGWCYAMGKGVEKNNAKSIDYWKEGVERFEDVHSMDLLGDTYENGTGVPRDYKKAMEFYKISCAKSENSQSDHCKRIPALEAKIAKEKNIIRF